MKHIGVNMGRLDILFRKRYLRILEYLSQRDLVYIKSPTVYKVRKEMGASHDDIKELQKLGFIRLEKSKERENAYNVVLTDMAKIVLSYITEMKKKFD